MKKANVSLWTAAGSYSIIAPDMFEKLKPLIHSTYWLIPLMVVLIFFFHFFRLIDFHELDAVDLRFRLRGEQKAHSDMVLVTIDDDSLISLGAWPWPRSTYAVFLDILSRYHPRSIFFDILLTENGPDAQEDEMLQTTVRKTRNVYLPFFYSDEKPFEALFPIEPLRKAATGVGYINPVLDPDGRIRRFKAFIDTDEGIYFHAAVAMLRDGVGTDTELKRWLTENFSLDADHNMWIDYPGSMQAYRVISFREVMEATMTNQERKLQELFQDRIVIVGHTATGTSLIDVKSTPFSPQEPGVLILAGAVHTLLSKISLKAMPALWHLVLLLFLAGAIAFVTHGMTPLRALIWTCIFSLAYLIIGLLLFIFAKLMIPLFVPVTVMILSYFIALLIKHIEIRFQREIAERELQAASKIQLNFLPWNHPESEHLEVAFDCRFSKTVGGDLYSWIDLGEDRFGFCVGDVAGKGMPASLYMSKCVSDFRSIDKRNLSPGCVLRDLNNILCATGVPSMFLTLLYVIVDIRKKKIFYASAGHEHMFFYNAETQKVEELEAAQGVPLGIMDGMDYETAEKPVHNGDAFLLFSDGVKELRNYKKEEFGAERIRITFEKGVCENKSARDIILYLFETMGLHQGKNHAHDDRTLLYVKCLHLSR